MKHAMMTLVFLCILTSLGCSRDDQPKSIIENADAKAIEDYKRMVMEDAKSGDEPEVFSE